MTAVGPDERMDWDLIVIGGGVGGLSAAQAALKLGARVLVVEKRALGQGYGSSAIAARALGRAARVARLQRTAERFGLPPHAPALADGRQVLAQARAVMAQAAARESPERLRALGAEVLHGAPRFASPGALELDGRRLEARAFVVATGSHPTLPPIPGLVEARALTPESLFQLEALPESLAVLGGGPVGLALAQSLARLGVRVTVLESEDRLLPADEPEVSTAIRARLEAEGLVVHTATTVERVERDGGERDGGERDGGERDGGERGDGERDGGERGDGARLDDGERGDGARLDGGAHVLRCVQAGSPLTVRAQSILVVVGRRPNLDGLDLGAAGVDFDERRIFVDTELRTSNPRVFAVGDVAGQFQSAQTAAYEGVLAVRNALLPLATRSEYRAIPFATFTDPEAARVGLTVAEAQRGVDPVTVLEAPLAATDRALTDGDEAGFVKLVAVRGRLVGAHLVGAHASELIHPAVLAVREQLKLSSLAQMGWVYPTLSEAFRKASQSPFEQLLEKPRVRTAVRWLRRLKSRD